MDLDQLSPIQDFTQSLDESHFTEVAEDWFILITDVMGSTKAIEANRYRDVNKVGVTIIAALRNTLGNEAFPFVFGGDGASALLSPSMLERCRNDLAQLPEWIKTSYQLDLRVGVIPFKEVKTDGYQLSIAKYQLMGKTCIWFFEGGALGEAEKRIKADPDTYRVVSDQQNPPNCSGLSCRWKPTPSSKGKVLAILIESQQNNPKEHYRNILQSLNDIFQGNIQSVNPTDLKNMSYLGLWSLLKDELREFKSIFSKNTLFRMIEILYCQAVFRFKLPAVLIDAPKYLSELAPLSDYYKFDEMIRLVVDCTPQQSEAIETYLKDLYQKGDIYYGIHPSDHSLMTCYVASVGESDHLHFIDGGDGGYAMAAKGLKQQKKKN